MTIAISKIFGQAKPVAATLSDLCTIGAGKEGQGLLRICNQATTDEKVRVAHLPGGDIFDPKHYRLYDTTIPANGIIDDPFDLPAGAVIKVYSLGGNCSFTTQGLEVAT
jgi:hypothetical protein